MPTPQQKAHVNLRFSFMQAPPQSYTCLYSRILSSTLCLVWNVQIDTQHATQAKPMTSLPSIWDSVLLNLLSIK